MDTISEDFSKHLEVLRGARAGWPGRARRAAREGATTLGAGELPARVVYEGIGEGLSLLSDVRRDE